MCRRSLIVILTPLLAGATALGISRAAAAPEPLSLDGAVQLALRQHPRLTAADRDTDAARARQAAARAPALPRVDWSAGYADANPFPQTQRQFTSGVSLSQPLYDSGRVRAQVKEAGSGVTAALAAHDQTAASVALDARIAYFGVLRARDLVGVAEEQQRQAEAHRKQAEALYQAGTGLKAGVLRAQVAEAEARVTRLRADNSLRLARVALDSALGTHLPPDQELEPPKGTPPPIPAVEDLLAQALRQRPELHRNAAQVEGAASARAAAHAASRPDLSLRGGWGWGENSFPPTGPNWSVGVVLGLPLFDGGAARARVAEAEADEARSRADEALLRQQIEVDVRQAALDCQEARERIAAAAAQLESARENLRMAEGRYREGVASMIELQDAQTAFTAAKAAQVNALYDLHTAHARTSWAVGDPVEKGNLHA